MGGIVFKNAQLLVNGANLTAAMSELGAQYSAEMLDGTTFGNDTRINVGGLKRGQITGKGFFDNAIGTEQVLFGNVGNGSALSANQAYQNGSQLEDTIIAVFPDGVVEGSVCGYAMKGSLDKFNFGGAVGILAPVDFSAQSRGIEA